MSEASDMARREEVTTIESALTELVASAERMAEEKMAALKIVKQALGAQEQRNQDLLGIRNELQRRLTASEAANAAMRQALNGARLFVYGDTKDENKTRAAIAKEELEIIDAALCTDAGRGWIPVEDVRPLLKLLYSYQDEETFHKSYLDFLAKHGDKLKTP